MTEKQHHPMNTVPRGTPLSTSYPALLDILDSLPFGIVLLKDSGFIQAVNMEGARLLGQQQATLLGESFPDLWSTLTESDTAAVMKQLHTVVALQQPIPHTAIRLRHGTTGSISVQWTCQAITHESHPGQFGLAISLRDLSREEELREERDRLATIADEAPSPIVEFDHDGHILYANPAMMSWLAMLGYRADSIPTILPPDLLQIVTQCLQSGAIAHNLEVFLPQASFTWTFCPVMSNRLVRGYAIDITKSHEAQRDLIQTADRLHATNHQLDEALTAAQESARAKSAFLAMMSHEIRTPMNGVIGMTSLLMETALSAEQRSYAETISQCGESLLHIIDDVLECSKIEAGKLELEYLDFDLRATVDEILTQFAKPAEIKDIELSGLVHSTVPTALRGDPGRLRQVLTNLVSNALKFTERGEVTLQAYLEQTSPSNVTVRFEVTDSGIGIDPEAQAKLFKPFVQADSSTTRNTVVPAWD